MGKRKGISIELDINSTTLDNISKLWDSFSKTTGLKSSQIEGIMYNISNDKKINYLITERITSNKKGLSLLDASEIIPHINDTLGITAGYCIVHIPEKGWTHKKIDLNNDEYIAGLSDGSAKFRTERFNPIENKVSIRMTSLSNMQAFSIEKSGGFSHE